VPRASQRPRRAWRRRPQVRAQQIAVMRSVCPKSTDRGIGGTLQPQYLPAKDKNGILSNRLSAIICSYQTTSVPS